jgi:hypothetical protein
MVVYESARLFIESATTLEAKIAAIDSIIDGLYAAAATAAGKDDISEYSLNDGQVIIKTVYRGAEAIGKAVKIYEQQRQMYINRLNGRHIWLKDKKNFIR